LQGGGFERQQTAQTRLTGRRGVRWIAALIALLVVASAAAILWIERRQELGAATELASRRTSKLADDLQGALTVAQAALVQLESTLSAMPPGTPLERALPQALTDIAPLLASLPTPLAVQALGADGRPVGPNTFPFSPDIPVLALPERSRWRVGSTFGVAERRWVPLARRATINQHTVAAWLVAFDHPGLLMHLDSAREQEGGGTTLFRLDGDGSTVVLARVPHKDTELGQRIRGPVATALPRAAQGSFVAVTQIDQVERVVAYQRLEGDASDLVLAYGIATEAVLRPWRAALPWAGAIVTLLLAALGLGAYRLDRALRVQQVQQAALHESELHFRALAENLPDTVVRLDREGRHLYANPAVEKATGLPSQAFIGKTNAELGMPAENVQQWMAALGRVFERGRGERLEFAYPGPEGLRHWESQITLEPEVKGLPRSALVISRDITARKLADAEREAANQRLADLLETMSDGFVSLDREWRYRAVNRKAGEMLGRDPADLIGRHIWTEFPDVVGQSFQRAYERAMNDGQGSLLEAHYARWDRWYENRIHPAADGISIFFTDITERVRTAQALRESEERLRLALQAANQGLYDLDLRTGEAVVSPEYARMLGWEPEEFHETNAFWRERMHPDDRASVYQVYEDYVAGRRDDYRVEFRQQTRDGSWKWILSMGQIQERDDQGQPLRMLGTHTDITAIKRVQTALAESESRLRYLLGRAPTVIYTARAEGDYAATYYSPNLAGMLGWKPEQFLRDGAFWLDHIHPQDRPDVLARMDELLERDSLVLEYRFQHADGRWRWMRDEVGVERGPDGKATELVGSWVDITERREAEDEVRRLAAELEQRVVERTAQLARSEARYRTIFETVPVSIGEEDWSGVQRLLRELRAQGVGDAAEFFAARPDFVQQCLQAVKVQRLNRQALALHDAQHLQDGVKGLQAFYPRPQDLAQFVGELEALWAGQRLFTAKRSLPSVSGRPLQLMLTMSLPGIDDEDATALVCLVDITEIDRLNAELERSVVRLREVNRELETFTYSVSHDLKAPLRGIDGYSRLLLSDHGERLDAEGREFLEHIRHATRQMGALIDDLLSYSRLERREQTLTRLPLAAVLDVVVSGQRHELQAAGVELALRIDPELQVVADAQGLTLALRNLLDNAIKFSRGSVPPRIVIEASRRDGGVDVSVRDNGVGFDMKFHDRIFSIFQRLHRAEDYPGTGIGLAIVRKAMERMGGRVRAQSRPAEGATFTLHLPETDLS
jgi:PAS domain S-box-containing protein